jgi:hypothetical protein
MNILFTTTVCGIKHIARRPSIFKLSTGTLLRMYTSQNETKSFEPHKILTWIAANMKQEYSSKQLERINNDPKEFLINKWYDVQDFIIDQYGQAALREKSDTDNLFISAINLRDRIGLSSHTDPSIIPLVRQITHYAVQQSFKEFDESKMNVLFTDEQIRDYYTKVWHELDTTFAPQIKDIGKRGSTSLVDRRKQLRLVVAKAQMKVIKSTSPEQWIAFREALDEWVHRVHNHDNELREMAEHKNEEILRKLAGSGLKDEKGSNTKKYVIILAVLTALVILLLILPQML